jgi:transposase
MNVKYPILGIDVSKATLDVCLLEEGDERTPLTIPNTSKGFASLMRVLTKHSVEPWTACLEATNVYSAAIAVYLHEHGATVILANPAAVHAFMQAEMRRAKTDKADAASIANFARAMAEKLRPWQPLPGCYAELRDLTRRLYAIRCNGARVKNQIEKTDYLTSEATTAIARSLRADLAHHEKQARAILEELASVSQEKSADAPPV